MLSIRQLGKIVDALREYYDVSNTEEVTLEANPEDLSLPYLKELKELRFFNRLSIGVQSFHDDDLRMLNRRHSATQAIEAVTNAQTAGFDNVSLDLIYGLPGQTDADWLDNLAQAGRLGVTHLSAYFLTIEEDTILAGQVARGTVKPASEDETLRHYKTMLSWVKENGFEQYEISNFCRPGFRARHNSRYWDRTPYLGVGAAAHSFDGEYRRWNVSDVGQYIESATVGHIAHDEEQLGLKEAHNEYVMTALRTVEGIDKSKVAAPFAARLAKEVGRFVVAGLIEETATHYRPTAEGLLHADGIASDLFID